MISLGAVLTYVVGGMVIGAVTAFFLEESIFGCWRQPPRRRPQQHTVYLRDGRLRPTYIVSGAALHSNTTEQWDSDTCESVRYK